MLNFQFSKIIFLIVLLPLIVGCGSVKSNNGYKKKITLIGNNQNYTFNVEIADDPQERSRGLMFREKLSEYDGMLFVFDTEDYQSFWMKNTKIPLDLLYFDSRGEMVDYKDDFMPCLDGEDCDNYFSKGRVKYALEINSDVLEVGEYKFLINNE